MSDKVSDKEIKFIVGRFNPPTPGHLKMIIAAYEGQWKNNSLFIEDELDSNNIGKQKPPLIIFPTYSHGPKKGKKENKDPLTFDKKREHLKNIIENGLDKFTASQPSKIEFINFNKNPIITPNIIYINETPPPSKGRNMYGNPSGNLFKLKEKYKEIH